MLYEVITEDGIPVYYGIATALLGEKELEAVELDDGRKIPCEMIMSTFGWHLNDDFLKELDLKRDGITSYNVCYTKLLRQSLKI